MLLVRLDKNFISQITGSIDHPKCGGRATLNCNTNQMEMSLLQDISIQLFLSEH